MTALQGSPLDKEKTGLDSCVHCGFCLQACPTYIALEDENESPRGRLLLMGALLEGTVAPDDAEVGRHLDQCLGCRGCETACPAGVPYGRLLEATRATLIEHRPLPFLARLVLGIFARPWALRLALWGARILRASGLASLLGRVLPARVAMPFAMLASTARPAPRRDAAAAMQSRGGATLLTGCVMEGLLPSVNRATERVLARQGWTVHATEGQRCCGALHAHAGDAVGARALARANIAAFERPGDSTIVMNSAGCGAMCKEYGHLLADDPPWSARANAFAARVRDVHELLVPLAPAAAQAPSRRVAYDAPCHLQHGQRIVDQPTALLSSIPAITMVLLADSDQCCGSAGIFNLIRPEVAERVLAPKLARITESGAEVVATGNPGCLMQIGGGLVRTGSLVVARHPVELLDDAYASDQRPR